VAVYEDTRLSQLPEERSAQQPLRQSSQLQKLLGIFSQPLHNATLTGIKRGLEKESLRITADGTLAQTDHPLTLGSALKHPHITTDYSEALLEFITEPFNNIAALLQQLDEIHCFTYQQLEQHDERLWPASMPCILGTDDQIPVARYGSSNSGTMKTIYRVGLGHRYGRSMQTIAGIHYNFSLPNEFWLALQQEEGNQLSLQDYKTQRYFALIRNFRRYFWLLIYLFGASPAVCGSFVKGRHHTLQAFDAQAKTLYMPHATSLRMGDLGYQSDAQQTLIVCYNNLSSYLKTLYGAICKTHPEYAAVGVKDAAGNYQQLNTSLLQIENEFYSSIRPKHPAQSGETALQALRLRGVEYVEVRCIDLNPYEPLGITDEQMHLMDAFLLFCLLHESPVTGEAEYREHQTNQKRVVYEGRDPQLQLLCNGEAIAMRIWAEEILAGTAECAALLDQANGGDHYQRAVTAQYLKLEQPELTPSARVLRDMHTEQRTFFGHTMALAEQHRHYFAARPLSAEKEDYYRELASRSLDEQRQLEASSQLPFEEYLENYYAQYRCCG
jgi:glutamate--cysteine ligase